MDGRCFLAVLLLSPMLGTAAAHPRCRCKRLMAERDEARAEGFAEAALAVEQSVEIDKLSEYGWLALAATAGNAPAAIPACSGNTTCMCCLAAVPAVRSKDMLLQRLHTTEQQLLATYRDEASSDLIQVGGWLGGWVGGWVPQIREGRMERGGLGGVG